MPVPASVLYLRWRPLWHSQYSCKNCTCMCYVHYRGMQGRFACMHMPHHTCLRFSIFTHHTTYPSTALYYRFCRKAGTAPYMEKCVRHWEVYRYFRLRALAMPVPASVLFIDQNDPGIDNSEQKLHLHSYTYTIQYSAVRYNTIKFSIVRCSVLYCNILYYSTL